MRIAMTEFARPRLFPREPRPNTIQDITAEEFERYLNDGNADGYWDIEMYIAVEHKPV